MSVFYLVFKKLKIACFFFCLGGGGGYGIGSITIIIKWLNSLFFFNSLVFKIIGNLSICIVMSSLWKYKLSVLTRWFRVRKANEAVTI